MTKQRKVINNLARKVAIVTAIHIASTVLNSAATYIQYQQPINTKSSIISFAAITIPGSIGSLGSSLYLKDNSEKDYLYLGLHVIPFATRALTYFIAPDYS